MFYALCIPVVLFPCDVLWRGYHGILAAWHWTHSLHRHAWCLTNSSGLGKTFQRVLDFSCLMHRWPTDLMKKCPATRLGSIRNCGKMSRSQVVDQITNLTVFQAKFWYVLTTIPKVITGNYSPYYTSFLCGLEAMMWSRSALSDLWKSKAGPLWCPLVFSMDYLPPKEMKEDVLNLFTGGHNTEKSVAMAKQRQNKTQSLCGLGNCIACFIFPAGQTREMKLKKTNKKAPFSPM